MHDVLRSVTYRTVLIHVSLHYPILFILQTRQLLPFRSFLAHFAPTTIPDPLLDILKRFLTVLQQDRGGI